ncbi:MAG: hypothetical protein KatS3mg083_297 [Candidatus Dojkabacteria bacterium]|nr:MAG: hypothetical protein KatS3mg083_297 [Candidatus Dojkabacteria bacterium]
MENIKEFIGREKVANVHGINIAVEGEYDMFVEHDYVLCYFKKAVYISAYVSRNCPSVDLLTDMSPCLYEGGIWEGVAYFRIEESTNFMYSFVSEGVRKKVYLFFIRI